MKNVKQMSESIRLGMLLAISGGFMDAYSYMERDHVFANAQTGNILLFGVNLSERDWASAMRYFFPVFAFALGIAVAEMVRSYNSPKLHWRQISVLVEAIILAGVSCIPLSMNLPANALISFACGIQVESFRKIRGSGMATTMCIGNLRSATQNFMDYRKTKDREKLKNSCLYYGIIACFAFGAVLGNFFVSLLGQKAVLCCSVILLAVFFIMFIDYEENKDEKYFY